MDSMFELLLQHAVQAGHGQGSSSASTRRWRYQRGFSRGDGKRL
uniref:Uncharacterized protein n=1 Tax=Arundo donax TaxID=35708 RepID=A0A0A9HHC5_ARUDO